jgi:hypothetical protein
MRGNLVAGSYHLYCPRMVDVLRVSRESRISRSVVVGLTCFIRFTIDLFVTL